MGRPVSDLASSPRKRVSNDMTENPMPTAPGPAWSSESGATAEEVSELRRQFTLEFPESFFALLRHSNGGEGELALWPGWFVLDPVHEIARQNGGSFESGEMAGLFVFGGNSGLELIAFDTRNGAPWPVVAFDPIAGLSSVERIAATLDVFLAAVGHTATANGQQSSI
jgi:hypothetical protein